MTTDIVQRLREYREEQCIRPTLICLEAAKEIERLRVALEFYRDESLALSINLAGKKSEAVMASVTVLSLDAGKRAIDAMVPTPNDELRGAAK